MSAPSVGAVLVPVGENAGNDAQIRRAADLARLFGARVHVLCVVDTRLPAPLARLAETARLNREALAWGRSVVDAAASALAARLAGGGDVKGHVREGAPAGEILRFATANRIDLIVMGTHARRGVERLLLGSLAREIVRAAPVPVLTVRVGGASARIGERPLRKILVPLDGSRPARGALRWAARIARRAGATVEVVYLVDRIRFPSGVSPVGLGERDRAWGRRLTTAAVRLLRRAGVASRAIVRKGVPAEEIVARARETEVDLIAMGTHGRRGLGRFLVGSTAEEVLRRSPVPVLTVRGARRRAGEKVA